MGNYGDQHIVIRARTRDKAAVAGHATAFAAPIGIIRPPGALGERALSLVG